jgi:hypothetical protein
MLFKVGGFDVAAEISAINLSLFALPRRSFSATFFLACLAALELEGVVLEEI